MASRRTTGDDIADRLIEQSHTIRAATTTAIARTQALINRSLELTRAADRKVTPDPEK